MSGLSADARTLVDHARSEAQYHRFTYNEPMPVESLTQSLYMSEHGSPYDLFAHAVPAHTSPTHSSEPVVRRE
eukprot:scaffold109199_cov35-Tisochrysis_lutea.AAC.4